MRRTGKCLPPVRRAFSLVEVVLSIGLLSILLVATLDAIGAAARGRTLHVDQTRAHLLAQDLMDEILQQHFEEPVEATSFGPEPSETGGSRTDFDDIDDYHGWNMASTVVPPADKAGVPYPGLDDWVRSVTVEHADPDALNQPGTADQGVKRITVRVARDGRNLATLVMIVTESWVRPPYE